jgi:hypothetical protein
LHPNFFQKGRRSHISNPHGPENAIQGTSFCDRLGPWTH